RGIAGGDFARPGHSLARRSSHASGSHSMSAVPLAEIPARERAEMGANFRFFPRKDIGEGGSVKAASKDSGGLTGRGGAVLPHSQPGAARRENARHVGYLEFPTAGLALSFASGHDNANRPPTSGTKPTAIRHGPKLPR